VADDDFSLFAGLRAGLKPRADSRRRMILAGLSASKGNWARRRKGVASQAVTRLIAQQLS
jgi:hypothetical protein